MNVILDHVLSDQAWTYLREDLDRLPVMLVGVRCPTEILQRREQRRGDRAPGLAASQAHLHEGRRYDVEVDTSLLSSAEGAAKIVDWLSSHAA